MRGSRCAPNHGVQFGTRLPLKVSTIISSLIASMPSRPTGPYGRHNGSELGVSTPRPPAVDDSGARYLNRYDAEGK